jgi:hypothetical protein
LRPAFAPFLATITRLASPMVPTLESMRSASLYPERVIHTRGGGPRRDSRRSDVLRSTVNFRVAPPWRRDPI